MSRFAPLYSSSFSINPRAWDWVPAVLRVDVPWLAGMSWTRVWWLFVATLGFTLSSLSGQIIRVGGWGWPDGRDFTLDVVFWFVTYLIFFAPMLITLTIADNLPVVGTMRIVVLAAALLLGAQFQWPINCACYPKGQDACDDFPSFLWRSWVEILPETTLWNIVYCTPIAMVYFYRRRDQEIARALHDSEVARTELQRRTLEAELQTMQARVEPSFLFDTLGDIGELQGRDSEAGERMLDELILYLRAALPDTAAARSTLGQEAALARAYLEILRIRTRGRLDYEVAVPNELEDTPIPAMVVLPLLTAAVGKLAAGDGALSVRMHVIADAGRTRAVITCRGPALHSVADSPVVIAIRQRLRTLYGDRHVLHVEDQTGRELTAVLDLIDAK